jgi:hypothetical protein
VEATLTEMKEAKEKSEAQQHVIYRVCHVRNNIRNFFFVFFVLKDQIYLQSVTIHSANGGQGERWHVEEYSVALL